MDVGALRVNESRKCWRSVVVMLANNTATVASAGFTAGFTALYFFCVQLLSTAEEVNKLQEELEVMNPMLEEAVQESIVTMEKITVDTAVAEETKAVVQKEETLATEKAKETQMIADDAQRDLNEALPALVSCILRKIKQQ